MNTNLSNNMFTFINNNDSCLSLQDIGEQFEKENYKKIHIKPILNLAKKYKQPICRNITSINDNLQINIDEKYKNINNIFNDLKNMKQPEQRTKEWYSLRENMITASDIGAILGKDKYRSPLEIMKRKLGYIKSDFNFAIMHGTKFEKIAQMLYSHIFNTKVRQFGLIQSNKYLFLGASPDGINDKYTLNDEFNKLYGRMIEIKCPTTRTINNIGKIEDIISENYWCQVQIQLEICDLEECDFVQCKFVEVSRDEIILDNINKKDKNNYTFGNENLKIKDNLTRGGFLIINNEHSYPPSLNLKLEDYDKWIINNINNSSKTGIIWWILQKIHVETIKRDRIWFQNNKDELKKFFDKMIYYKKNIQEFEQMLDKNNKKQEDKKDYTLFSNSQYSKIKFE